MADIDLNIELGPLFTVDVENNMGMTVDMESPITQRFTLDVGVKTSSLLAVTGAASPNVHLTVTSAEALGLYRAVTAQGTYCQPTQTGLGAYCGITSVSVPISTAVKVIVKGLITEGGWSWTPDAPIFVGSNGVLTQAAGSLPMRRIGWAISATQINFDPYPIIGA